MTRIVFYSLGFISLSFALLGVVLPLLPTTPFVLFSAYCFARSSPKFHSYLINHPVLGVYIQNYREGTMTKPHKIKTLTLLWASILLSVYLAHKLIVAIILPLIALAVSIHLLRLQPSNELG